jgi:hypothetical protein
MLSKIEKYLFFLACLFLLFVVFKTKVESFNLLEAFMQEQRKVVVQMSQHNARITALEGRVPKFV